MKGASWKTYLCLKFPELIHNTCIIPIDQLSECFHRLQGNGILCVFSITWQPVFVFLVSLAFFLFAFFLCMKITTPDLWSENLEILSLSIARSSVPPQFTPISLLRNERVSFWAQRQSFELFLHTSVSSQILSRFILVKENSRCPSILLIVSRQLLIFHSLLLMKFLWISVFAFFAHGYLILRGDREVGIGR